MGSLNVTRRGWLKWAGLTAAAIPAAKVVLDAPAAAAKPCPAEPVGYMSDFGMVGVGPYGGTYEWAPQVVFDRTWSIDSLQSEMELQRRLLAKMAPNGHKRSAP